MSDERQHTRREGTEKRRRAILDAALVPFVERGPAGTPIEEIVSRSGASVGSIYHHFGSKEGIALELYLESVGDAYQAVLLALRQHQTAREGVEALVHAYLDWAKAHPTRARFVLQRGPGDFSEAQASQVRSFRSIFYDQVLAWLAPFVRSGEVQELPRELYDPVVLGPTHEFVRRWLAGWEALDLEAARPHLARAAWRTLAAGEIAPRPG